MFKSLLAIAIICCLAGTTQADIFALGDLPGGDFNSQAYGVSADGAFVVGKSSSTATGTEAFLWSQTTGMVGLGDLPGGTFNSNAYGVSNDGSVVVGEGQNAVDNQEAFRWTQEGGMVGLGFLPGMSNSEARGGVSADGSVVAGRGWGGEISEAYRWTQAGGMIALGDLSGNISARDISADGSVVVGADENGGDSAEAYRWTESTGVVGLGFLPGGALRFSRANGVSADGSVVLGVSWSANGLEAFRWTESTGMVGLGDLPGGDFLSRAYGASADGSVVVGRSISINGYDAFVWTQNGGMVSLADLLAAQGDDVSYWTSLFRANDISADGRTIVGYGININGDTEAFVATLLGDVTTVAPNSYSVTRGAHVSGGVVELAESDNADLSLRRATADTQSRTEFEIKAISPMANPTSLEVSLEGAVFARSQVDQTIELFDYVAAAWEQVDIRAATRFTDSTVTVAATGDLSRFVEAGTMCIEARIRYQSLNPRQQFSSNTDQFMWTIGQ